MDSKNTAPLPAFISYAHRDEKYLKAMEPHLSVLERTRVIAAWHFRDTYHRPDVIDLVLETLDEAEALRRAGVERG